VLACVSNRGPPLRRILRRRESGDEYAPRERFTTSSQKNDEPRRGGSSHGSRPTRSFNK
jgi:hypothetical protein